MTLAILSCGLLVTFFLYAWYIDSGCKIVLTPLLIFSVYFILRVAPGFFYGVHYYGIGSIYFAYIPFLYLSFCVGYLVIAERRDYSSSVVALIDVCKQSEKRKFEIPIVVFSVIVFLLGLLFYKGLPPAINSAVGMASSSMDVGEIAGSVSEARREISKGHVFGGEYKGQGIFRELIFIFSVLLVGMGSTYFFCKTNFRSLIFLIISIVLAYVFVSGDGTRGRFLVVFTVFFIVMSITRKIGIIKALSAFLVLVLVSIMLGLYTNKMVDLFEQGDWNAIIVSALERIFIGNSINDVVAIRAFEDGYLDYGWGYWLMRDFLAFIPGFSLDKPLAYYLYLYEIGGGNTTYLTGTAISRGVADGGILVAGLYFSILGAICKIYARLCRKLFTGAPFDIGILAAMWVVLGQAYVSGIAGVVFLATMLIILVSLYKIFQKGFQLCVR